MSKFIYNLQISCSGEDRIEKVSNLLRVEPNKHLGKTWCLEIQEEEDDEYFDFVKHYLDILEGKYAQLASIGIAKEDISIWLFYEYDNQCNMEFLPNDLKRLGDHGISLCISCWASS